MQRRHCLAVLGTALGTQALAQSWPTRPITLVVPTAPGGVIDSVARAMAEEMGTRLGQTLIVDNKAGASGMLAVQTVARARPDGYTLLVANSTAITNLPYLVKKLPYDVQRDLSFISQICAGQLLLTVNSDMVPARTMQQFLDWARSRKGQVSYGSYGQGTVGHLIGAYLSGSRALDMTHIAYKGEAPMLQDMLGGQIAWGITSALTAGPHLHSGKLRALAVIGTARAATLPEVPTMAEAGLPEPQLQLAGWIGLMAPAGTPADALQRIEDAARAAAMSTAMRARFQVYAMAAIASSSAQFRQDVARSAPLYEELIRSAGLVPQ